MSEPSHVSQTRAAYDIVADDYAALLADVLAASIFDRAVLSAFAELVLTDGGGPVGDLGCGPGRVTAHLASLGLSAFGVDLSPGMVAVARRTYPHLRFDQGSISDLAIADGVLAGAATWYSLIHTPPSLQPSVFASFIGSSARPATWCWRSRSVTTNGAIWGWRTGTTSTSMPGD